MSRGGPQRDERANRLASSGFTPSRRPPSSPPRHRSYPELPSSNYWRFNDPAAINRDPIPSSIFAIPDECDAMCQTTHLTYAERLQMRADLEMKKRRA